MFYESILNEAIREEKKDWNMFVLSKIEWC